MAQNFKVRNWTLSVQTLDNRWLSCYNMLVGNKTAGNNRNGGADDKRKL
jgi:hypothetical protein